MEPKVLQIHVRMIRVIFTWLCTGIVGCLNVNGSVIGTPASDASVADAGVDASLANDSSVIIPANSRVIPPCEGQGQPYVSNAYIKVNNLDSADVCSAWQRARSNGRKLNLFTVGGDSNSDNDYFLWPFRNGDTSQVQTYPDLVTTVRTFDSASFKKARGSKPDEGGAKTSVGGYTSGDLIKENRLDNELQQSKASMVLILIGTNDYYYVDRNIGVYGIPGDTGFQSRLQMIINTCKDANVLPVLFTKADDRENDLGQEDKKFPPGTLNNMIKQVAGQTIPWVDLGAKINEMYPNHAWSPDSPPVHYTVEAYGARNVIVLQALAQLRMRLGIGQ